MPQLTNEERIYFLEKTIAILMKNSDIMKEGIDNLVIEFKKRLDDQDQKLKEFENKNFRSGAN